MNAVGTFVANEADDLLRRFSARTAHQSPLNGPCSQLYTERIGPCCQRLHQTEGKLFRVLVDSLPLSQTGASAIQATVPQKPAHSFRHAQRDFARGLKLHQLITTDLAAYLLRSPHSEPRKIAP
ncbi:hypothetical protein D3C81_836350 [compost metagenome]